MNIKLSSELKVSFVEKICLLYIFCSLTIYFYLSCVDLRNNLLHLLSYNYFICFINPFNFERDES
jgi:hypothetical protein